MYGMCVGRVRVSKAKGWMRYGFIRKGSLRSVRVTLRNGPARTRNPAPYYYIRLWTYEVYLLPYELTDPFLCGLACHTNDHVNILF